MSLDRRLVRNATSIASAFCPVLKINDVILVVFFVFPTTGGGLLAIIAKTVHPHGPADGNHRPISVSKRWLSGGRRPNISFSHFANHFRSYLHAPDKVSWSLQISMKIFVTHGGREEMTLLLLQTSDVTPSNDLLWQFFSRLGTPTKAPYLSQAHSEYLRRVTLRLLGDGPWRSRSKDEPLLAESMIDTRAKYSCDDLYDAVGKG
ncbi:hypothetical protein DL96DRAFT_1556610 [Flagelloscypha sp. PMI_526]|nr:hypothetical protein DL96DRAFT_1556610 [Flagelloscypha sp. PMI_526]